MKQYYNTNKLQGFELTEHKQSNAAQQEKVLKYFKEHPNQKFATFQIHQRLMSNAPHTSAQRCVSNLTEIGELRKTEHMINGPYNVQVHTWELANENDYEFLNVNLSKPKRLILKVKGE